MNENKYLTGIPQEIEQYGFAKVLLVRRELLHIKHIFTELFVRKNDLHFYIEDLHKYMTYMTNRMRKITHFSRNYSNNLDNIVKHESDRFFDSIKFYEGLDNVIVLDFQPTCENLAIYFAGLLKDNLPPQTELHSIRLYETPTSYVEWLASEN